MRPASLLRSVPIALLLAAGGSSVAVERVTVDNFKRAESDHYFSGYVATGCFAKLCNDRAARRSISRQSSG
jgi:hypothetical protein